MSVIRWRDHDINMNSNPKFLFPFWGNQATSTVTEVNDTWNLWTLRQNATQTIDGNTLDMLERYPAYGEVAVYHNGLLLTPIRDYTVTLATDPTKSTIKILSVGGVAGDDVVAFLF